MKLFHYVMRARMDMLLHLSSERLGPEKEGAIFNLFCANVDGQHRAIAVYASLLGMPVHDMAERHFDLSEPNLRKLMDCYHDAGIPLTKDSQILAAIPIRVANFYRNTKILRAMSEEVAKSTQDASGLTPYAALTTMLNALIDMSNHGKILHANRSNILQQESATVNDVLRSVRNASGSSMMTSVTPTSYHGQHELSNLEATEGTTAEKMKLVHDHINYLASGVQNLSDLEKNDDDRDHVSHTLCHGTGRFESPDKKSDLVLSTSLRGTMHAISFIAMSKESLLNFQQAAQMDSNLADLKSLEMIRACVIHTSTVVAGGNFNLGNKGNKKRLTYKGLWKSNLNQCVSIKQYFESRVRTSLYWNAITETMKDIAAVAIMLRGYTATQASHKMIQASSLVKAYDAYVRNGPDSTEAKLENGVSFSSMVEWSSDPPTSLLELALKSYPFILDALTTRINETDEVKRYMSASEEEKESFIIFPKGSKTDPVIIDAFETNSAMVYIPKRYRLRTMITELLADDEKKLGPDQVWGFPSKLTKAPKARSRSPKARPLPTLRGKEN